MAVARDPGLDAAGPMARALRRAVIAGPHEGACVARTLTDALLAGLPGAAPP